MIGVIVALSPINSTGRHKERENSFPYNIGDHVTGMELIM